MKFLAPDMFWHLVWILPCMAAVFISAWYRRIKVLKSLTGLDKPDGISVIASPGMRLFRFLLLVLIVICLVTALARPAWDYETVDISGSGRDLMIVFDTSKSMLSRDVQPSRMEHAKWFVKELVKLNPSDRFGLVSFAGSAFQECPLTVDKTSFLQYISDLDTSTIPIGGTNIELALKTALEAFSAAEAINRAVILITDGDELSGNSQKVLDELAAKKIPLFVVGIGDPSQPSIIQYKDEKGVERILKDSAGNVVNSPLNEKQLIELARKTGGIYVRSTAADTGLRAIENRIRKLDAEEYASAAAQKPIERFSYPLWAAFLLLLLWMCLSERGKKKKLIAVLLASVFAVSAQEKTAQPESQQVPAEETLSPEQIYNKAVEIQKAEVPQNKDQKTDPLKTAEEFYLRALAAGTDKDLSGKIYQNLGVIYQERALADQINAMGQLQAQQPQEALKKYDSALKQLQTAEKFYQESMVSSENTIGTAKNQTLLLKMRKKIEEEKKKIEELLKKQQQARQQTQQAQQQQKKENQKQDQKQDQKQQSAKDMTSQAKQSAEELEKMAKEAGQKQMEQQAKSAKEELEKAEQAQNSNKNKKAEEHLKKASDILGSDKKNEQDKKDQKQGQNQDQKDQKDQNGKQNQELPQQPPQSAPQQKKGEQQEGEIDKDQAESILGQMADEEKELRNAVKMYRNKNTKLPPVTKDW